MLADIRRRVAVESLAALEQRHPVGLPARQHDVRTNLPRTTREQRGRLPGPTTATSARREVEVGRTEQVPEREWMAHGEGEQEPQHPQRVALVAALAGDQGQAQQTERRGRVAGWDRRVL